MGHANIYIRKEHEIFWDKLPDKSAWVNERLEQSFNHPQIVKLTSNKDTPAEETRYVEEWSGPLMRDKKRNKL